MAGGEGDNEALPFHGAAAKFETKAERSVTRTQLYLALAVTAIGVAWVFGLLLYEPSSSAPAQEEPAPVAAAPEHARRVETAKPSPELPPEQLAWRDQALAAVEDLTSRLQALEKKAVLQWAPENYKTLQAVVADGEKAYGEQRFRDARDLYTHALAEVSVLEAQLPAAFDTYWNKGLALLGQKHYPEAQEALEIAGLIAPEHEEVAAAINTAQHGAAVDRMLIKANFALGEGRAKDALEILHDASSLDPVRPDVKQLTARAADMARQQAFDADMKKGYAALSGGQYAAAIAAFRAAQSVDPKNQTAVTALQAAQKQQLEAKLADLKAQASSAMQREAWTAAQQLYSQALALQSGIAFAEAGLKKATFYRDKQLQLTDLIARPDRLADRAVADYAVKLVAELGADPALPPQLGGTRDKLSQLLDAYARPVAVTVRSDGVSDVSIVRGEHYRPFRQKTLQLKPGSYTLLARRSGYRDKRVSFQVPLDGHPVTVTVGTDEKL